MLKKIDPHELGLSPRAEINQIGPKQYAIVKNRKSRLIMSDGRKILEQAKQIQKMVKGAHVMLKTNAPLCSKTIAFLKDNKISIQ